MGIFKTINEDLTAALERDPAARSKFEIFMCYPGVYALILHRWEHFLYNQELKFLARLSSQITRHITGIEIHPGAKIGKGCFIDHGMAVVIGETAEVGDNCTLYQGVTLGGTGKDTGKRHPTLGNNVVVASGAKVLGPFKVGDNSKIGAGSVVLAEVPPGCTVVGIPGKIVRRPDQHAEDLNQVDLPDPVAVELDCLRRRIVSLEEQLSRLRGDVVNYDDKFDWSCKCDMGDEGCADCAGAFAEKGEEAGQALCGDCGLEGEDK